CLLLASGALAGQSPNVLMIVLDDLNDCVGVLGGHPQTHTPNIDRLAGEGVLFTNAHGNVPVCSPSRASFMTGVAPTTSGCWGFENWMQNPILINTKTLGEYAMANGYRALQTSKVLHNSRPNMWTRKGVPVDYGPLAFNGKKTVGHPSCPGTMRFLGALDATFAPLSDVPTVAPSADAPGAVGWWNAKWGKPSPFRYVNEDDRDSMTDEKSAEWLQKAIGELEKEDTETPFFIGFGIIRPHTPLVVPQKYFDMFPLETVQLPHVKSDDTDDLPWGSDSRGRRAFEGLKSGYQDPDEGLRRHTQAYLASVAFADDIVGRALATIENSRFKDNTIVILFSDHGYNLGEKECLWKYNLWEKTTRVPLIIKARRYAANAGKTVGHPVSLIDIYPTIKDLCGWTGATTKNSRGAPLDGHSLRPFLEDPATDTWDGPDVAVTVIASWKSQSPAKQHLSVRSRDFRYTRYHDGSEELYDHRRDPHEWHNLAADPEYTTTKADLKKRMFALIPKTTKAPPKTARNEAEAWKDRYFRKYPEADTNQDGILSWPELKHFQKKTGKSVQ
ncbi:MAG: sulfatase, partial [Lentisphaerae bacterium]|nr:sulfatase [Lentisphaerota bacterium]